VTSARGPGALARRLLQAAGLLAALVLAGGLPAPGGADEALPADLALVPSDGGLFLTLGVGHLAAGKTGQGLLARLRQDKDNLATAVEAKLGASLADVERLTFLPAEEVTIVRTTRPYDREKLLGALAPRGRQQKYKDRTYYHDDATGTDIYLVNDQVFLRSWSRPPGKGGLQRLWDRPTAKDAPLGEALRLAAGKHEFVAGVTAPVLLEYLSSRPPEAVRAEPLPPEALPYKPLLQARWATLVGDLGDELKVDVRLAFADKDVARDAEVSLRTALYVLRELLQPAFAELGGPDQQPDQLEALLGKLVTALKTAAVANDGTVVSATAHMGVEAATLGALAQALTEGARRRRVEANLRQIALATINSADFNKGRMPTNIFDKARKPLLSWRVALLPYVEEDALYRQFKLDEPWDSEHNKKLVAKMPRAFAGLNARLNEQGKTVLLAPTGTETAWPGGPDAMRFPASFPDGLSNTIFFVLADDAHAVEWTRPEDLKIDPQKPHAGLGQLAGRYLVAMGDGSAHAVKPTVSKETLWAAFTRAGGEVLGPDW
jgi:hypothetical protein